MLIPHSKAVLLRLVRRSKFNRQIPGISHIQHPIQRDRSLPPYTMHAGVVDCNEYYRALPAQGVTFHVYTHAGPVHHGVFEDTDDVWAAGIPDWYSRVMANCEVVMGFSE